MVILSLILIICTLSQKAGAVQGTVKDMSGNPIAGALVTFTNESDPGTSFIDYTDADGGYEIIPATVEVKEQIPIPFVLSQNYPNPFNPSTTIPFSLYKGGQVRLTVYAITGQKVVTLIDEFRSAGTYAANWNGRDDNGNGAASGIYLYRLTCGNHHETRKMLLLDGGGIVSGGSSQSLQTASKTARQSTGSYYTVTVIKGGYYDFTQEHVDTAASFDITLEQYTATYETDTTDAEGTAQVTDYAGGTATVTIKNAADEPVTGLELFTVSSPYGTVIYSTDPQDRYFDTMYSVSSGLITAQKTAPVIMWDFEDSPAITIEDHMAGEGIDKEYYGDDAENIWRSIPLLATEDPGTWTAIQAGLWDQYSGWEDIKKVTTALRISYTTQEGWTRTILVVKNWVEEAAQSLLISEYNNLNALINDSAKIVILTNDRKMGKSGTITGRVIDSDKIVFIGLPDVELSFTSRQIQDRVLPVTTTNSHGNYYFTGLPPGIYTIQARETTPMTITVGEKGVYELFGRAGEAVTIGPVKFRDPLCLY